MMFSAKSVGAVLLIAGTTIGAGMLALPLSTGVAGYGPSIIGFSLCFAYMFANLWVFLSANALLDNPSINIITMSRKLLGPWAERLAWLCFLLLLYAACAAYIAGGGSMLYGILKSFIKSSNYTVSMCFFAIFFSTIVICGASLVDCVNRLLMVILLGTYCFLIYTVFQHAQWANLTYAKPALIMQGIPVMVLAFTSHIILPNVREYLDSQWTTIKKVLFWGNVIPLAIYLLWQTVLLAMVPVSGPGGLSAISSSNDALGALNQQFVQKGLVLVLTNNTIFSIAALTTSFLGVASGLLHFFKDAYHWGYSIKDRVKSYLAVLMPPLLMAIFIPNGFLQALSYGGAFIAILYGILPHLMILKARRDNRQSACPLTWSSWVLYGLIVLSLGVVLIQVMVARGAFGGQ